MNSIQLNLSQKIWSSKLLCAELEQFLQQNSVRTQQRFKVITCILEALSNVLEHTDSHLEQIVVILHCDQEIITIDLLDNSPYTPIDDQVDCPSPFSLSGRGLWIIQNWMDQMRFQASVAGTHLRLSLLR
ncbi:anti-sigma regulatory factor (Ser/Thr protein kinase) [Shewanella psychrophila]|uniref:Anti-sigma regulatory factor (Ser/Thr protein kinase) n=1 Tax=Shewanella psychrophila TaxID=225848 RepID=A0A1S6HTC4_9GAMM|nr:ATP-binding protein [Shewanella psychrophila]AQS38806.1 anti-sigma regulatory factor (Ser/Thr protein kinase) [Shewanella psychrophila]